MTALVLLVLAALPPPRLKVADWGVERQRKSSSGATGQVTTSFSLANVAEKPVDEIRAKIVFYDSSGSVSYRTPRVRVRRIEPGGQEKLTISGTWVPVFLYYELFLDYNYEGRAESVKMLGLSAATVPDILSDRLLDRQIRLVVMGHDVTRTPQGVASVQAHVKNFGALDAAEVKCVVRFYDSAHTKIGEIAYPLGSKKSSGVIKGGEERDVRFILQNVPRYDGYDVYMKHAPPSVELLFSGGEFEMKEDVEVAHVKLERPEASVLSVELDVRNGFPKAVNDVAVTAVFFRKEKVRRTREDGLVGIFEEDVAFRKEEMKVGALAAGQVSHARQTVRNMGSFEKMHFEIAFGEKTEAPAVPDEAPRLEAQVTKAALRPDGTVELEGKVSNSGKKAVQAVVLRFHFRKKENGKPVDVHVEDTRLDGPLSPGEERAFSLAVVDCPPFEEYFYELSSE